VAAEGRPREVLDAVPDDVDAALVAGVEFEEVVLPVVAVDLLRDGDRRRRLPGARRPREQEVREVVAVDVALQALRDVGVSDDVFEALRSILLDPDFLPSAGGVCHARRQERVRLKQCETRASAANEGLGIASGERSEPRASQWLRDARRDRVARRERTQ